VKRIASSVVAYASSGACVCLCVLVLGCASSHATRPTPTRAEVTPLAALLASATCPRVQERVFSLASTPERVNDTYIQVKRCRARGEHDELRAEVDAYAWVAVDRDLGAVAVHAFLHATIHVELHARVSARSDGRRLEIEAVPLGEPTIAVEPVGAVDLTPENWASLLAIELAPSVGVSPEAVAKTSFGSAASGALRDALSRPLAVTYDPRLDTASTNGDTPTRAARYRVVPRGTALLGPFAATREPVDVRLRASGRVAVRGLCVSHVDHVLDADRRGDRVSIDDWTSAEGEARVAVHPMPCPWMLAARSDKAEIVELDASTLPVVLGDAPSRTDRWVSLDEIALEGPLEDESLSVVATTGLREVAVSPPAGTLPAIVVLAPDEAVLVRLVRREGESNVVEAEARLDLDAAGNRDSPVSLRTQDGRTTVRLHVRTRVRMEGAP
jgi:hypothetical protein